MKLSLISSPKKNHTHAFALHTLQTGALITLWQVQDRGRVEGSFLVAVWGGGGVFEDTG